MGRRRRSNKKRQSRAARKAGARSQSSFSAKVASKKGNISEQNRRSIGSQSGDGRYDSQTPKYKSHPFKWGKKKNQGKRALLDRLKKRIGKTRTNRRRIDRRVEGARSRIPIKRPKGRVKDRKLSFDQRVEAGRKLAQKNARRDDINKKHFQEVNELKRRLESSKKSQKEKVAGAKILQKTILPKSDIHDLLIFDLEKQFDRFGKVGPPYVGLIEKVVDSTTIKLSEDAFEDTEQDINGKLLTIQREGLMDVEVLDPPLWRDFKVEYPVKEKVKIDGQDIEDRDLQIGELEWTNDHQRKTLDLIQERTQQLVDGIITFFQLNGFLSGSVDELSLLGQDSATTLSNVKEELTAAQIEFQKWKAELDTLKAIHHNPYGCKAPDEITTGRVIPIFEFYDTITHDYVYSSNFEWHINQSAAEGYMFQRNYSGFMKDPKQVKFNELGMKYKYVNKGLYKIADVNSPKVLSALGAGSAVDWGEEGPDGAPADKFVVALEGYLKFPYAETYEFQLYANDTGFLEIQGEDGTWERIIEVYEYGESKGMRQESNPSTLPATGGPPPEGLSDAELESWKKKNSPGSNDNAGKFQKYRGYKVSKTMVNSGQRVGIRIVVSENKGVSGYRLEWRAKGKKTKILKKFSYRYKNGSYIRRWRRRHHYRTVTYWDYVEVDAYLPIEKQYLSLAAPSNYEFNRVAFGAYDPQEAEHRELSKYKHIHKFHMSLSLPELGGDKGDNKPRAMEAAGNHYLGDEEKPPKDVKHIKPDEWEDMGSDFAAIKSNLPKPHPELEKDYIGHGNTMPIHKFYNRETNTYRYMILPDGRTRQARTSEGVLKYTTDGRRVMETLDEMIGSEFVEQQAGRNNNHYEKYEGAGKDKKIPFKNKKTGEITPAPANIVGQGYEWKGIAFYGYEPPGLPPNVPPEVLIHEGKNSYATIIKKASWLKYHVNITLDAKSEDPDGKVTDTLWTIVNQEVDISHIRGDKPGAVVGRSGRIAHPFPIGKTRIRVQVTDNRGSNGSDEIDIVVLPPDKKDWKSLTRNEYVGNGGVASNRFILPYSKYVAKAGWDGYTEKHEYDIRDIANTLYQQGFKDSHRGRGQKSAGQLGGVTVTRKLPYQEKYQSGWHNSRAIRRWRWRTRRTPKYSFRTKYKTKTFAAKDLFSKRGMVMDAKTAKLRQYPSDSELKNLMMTAYERGYNHGDWPYYLADNDGPPNVRRKLQNPLLRDKITTKEKWQRSGINKSLKRASNKVRSFARKARKRWRKIWSDSRLKTNITPIGESKSGINIYHYNYIWSSKKYRGVIAQELLKTNPEAVDTRLGFYCVDYDMIDVNFKKVGD